MKHTEALTRINDCRDSHATTLDLSDLGLTELPSDIYQVPWITELNLSKNKLTALPSEISLLVNLEKLQLQENKLGKVPPQIFTLRNLIGLYLSDNDLQSLPPEIGLLTKLQELRIGYNEIRALPPEIGKLSALRMLRFGTNRVKDIPTEILALPNISEVSLLGNPLPPFPNHVDPRSNDAIWQFYKTSRGTAPGPKPPNPEPPIPEPPEPYAGENQTDDRAMRDQPSAEDSMGRSGMIEALAEFVSSPDSTPPLTVTIEAPWGDGKSSAMMQLRKYLTEKKKAQTVWFNPWRYTEAEALWSGFLAEFTEQMQKGKGFWEKLGIQWSYVVSLQGKWFWLKRLGSCFLVAVVIFLVRRWLMQMLPSPSHDLAKWGNELLTLLVASGSTIFLALKLWFAFNKPARTFVGEMKAYMKKPEYAANRGSSERLHCEFRAWLGACAKPGERIYVFIDDLDRCAGPRAAELLDWLQLMMSNTGNGDDASFPLVVIAGLAREKVAAAVAMKYREMLPIFAPADSPQEKAEAAIVWGYEYLEKFVDLPVRLPPGSLRALEPYLESLAPGAFEAEIRRAKRIRDAAVREDTLRRMGTDRTAAPIDLGESSLPQPSDLGIEAIEQSRAILEDPMIPYLLRAASGWLNNSPRKLKHFLNLLRLRWAVVQPTRGGSE